MSEDDKRLMRKLGITKGTLSAAHEQKDLKPMEGVFHILTTTLLNLDTDNFGRLFFRIYEGPNKLYTSKKLYSDTWNEKSFIKCTNKTILRFEFFSSPKGLAKFQKQKEALGIFEISVSTVSTNPVVKEGILLSKYTNKETKQKVKFILFFEPSSTDTDDFDRSIPLLSVSPERSSNRNTSPSIHPSPQPSPRSRGSRGSSIDSGGEDKKSKSKSPRSNSKSPRRRLSSGYPSAQESPSFTSSSSPYLFPSSQSSTIPSSSSPSPRNTGSKPGTGGGVVGVGGVGVGGVGVGGGKEVLGGAFTLFSFLPSDYVSSKLRTSREREKDKEKKESDLDFTEIPYSELDFQKRVGKGGSGSIELAKWGGKDVAVKQALSRISFTPDDPDFVEFQREVSALRSLRHPNIVQLYGACTKPPKIAIVTQYHPFGSLTKVLHEDKTRLSTAIKLAITCDIIRGLEYLHSNSIIHRDLKPGNVLIESFGGPIYVVLCDFGISKKVVTGNVENTSGRGTPEYMAPELTGSQYSNKVDIFAFAVTIWELFSETIPYSDFKFSYMIWDFVCAEKKRLPIPSHVPIGIQDVIQDGWAHNPSQRPTAKKCLEDCELMFQEFLNFERIQKEKKEKQIQKSLIESEKDKEKQKETNIQSRPKETTVYVDIKDFN